MQIFRPDPYSVLILFPAGCEESFQLGKEPAYYYLRRTVRLKFVPAEDPLKAPVIAPAKPAIIDGGFWGPGLLAGVLADKYLYHLPWSRQHVREKQRFGVDLSPQTMSDAADKVAGQCAILVARMKERMLAGGYLCADETFVRYLDPLEAKGSSTGCFWAYRGGGKDVIFDWQTSREHCHVGDWIGPDFEGVLLSDGYEAYSNYCKEQGRRGKNVRRAACLAHIRRKFEAAKDQRPELVAWVLRIIAQLYRIETPLREYQAGEEVRARVRERNSRPLIRLLGKAFKHLLTTSRILPKSSLGKALRYALAQWPHMGTYLEDGRVAIDNNDLENDIRPSAVGKRNWLFVGSPEAGRRGAVLYSLLISARNHGADPQAYLRDVIERLPGTRLDELDQLLPGAWAEAHRDAHPAILAPRSA